MLVGFVYPFFEGIAWNDKYGVQAWIEANAGAKFHDFAGSIVVHAVGGWIGLRVTALRGEPERFPTTDGTVDFQIRDIEEAGRQLNFEIAIHKATTIAQIDAAFDVTGAKPRAIGLIQTG